jgi:hypothetical protein
MLVSSHSNTNRGPKSATAALSHLFTTLSALTDLGPALHQTQFQ